MKNVSGNLVTILLEMLEYFFFDNSSSSHADNRKNDFLVLRQGPTYGI